MINYIEEDIHTAILKLEDNSINLIYTSPPYAICESSWDIPLNWELLFKEMWRILKPNGIILLHCSMPFIYELLKYETPRYHYSWYKNNNKTNFFKAKLQPLRNTEEILVYYKSNGTYNAQMIGDKFIKKKYSKQEDKQKTYGHRNNIKKTFVSETEGHVGHYPCTHLDYPIRRDGTGINRTDEMIDFFIKTYSNESDIVLDMTCHNNYVGDRCKILNRNYLGIDIKLDPKLKELIIKSLY
jgi:site-specific DNA-methyltransferase (adenine-specific)